MAILVTRGGQNRRVAVFGNRQEMMGMLRCPHRVDRYLQIAIGAILESDWAGKSRSHLAVQLALGGTGANCSPTDQVGKVLGGQ